MTRRTCFTHVAMVLCAGLSAGAIVGASAEAATPRAQYHFTYVPLKPGDRATEDFHFQLDVKTILSQESQVVGLVDQTVRHDEHSTVLRLPAQTGQTARAQITYDHSQQRVDIGRGESSKTTNRPVDGKTYIAARIGDELVITDPRGTVPPEDELKLVTRSMDALGRPNTLGIFFGSRTITVGEIVRLPAEFADRLLGGFDASLAGTPLDVMLVGTERIDDKQCAVLRTPPADMQRTSPEAKGAEKRVPIDAKLVVEIDTCRVAVLEISGPVSGTEQKGEPGQEFERRRKGKLHVTAHIQHERATR